MANLYRQVGEAAPPDNLIAGNLFPVKNEPVMLLAGQAYKRGDALGRVTASGKYTLADKDAADGTEQLFAVLLDDVDATSTDMPAAAALTGEFNWAAMRFKSGEWKDYYAGALRLNIYLSENKEFPEPVFSDVQTDRDMVALDRAWLVIGFAPQDNGNNVTRNVALSAVGAYGSTITWASSDSAAVNPATGIVARGEADVSVTLTATITKGSYSETKVFVITVKGA